MDGDPDKKEGDEEDYPVLEIISGKS